MSETPGAGVGLIDAERFRAVAADCSWSPAELRRFFVDGTREQLAELRAALAAGDATTVERLAHGCVGSSATCGVDGLAELFRQLERVAGDGDLARIAPALATVEARMAEVERLLAELAGESRDR